MRLSRSPASATAYQLAVLCECEFRFVRVCDIDEEVMYRIFEIAKVQIGV